MKKILFLLLACSSFLLPGAQQTEKPSPIIFIYDASGSMMGRIQGKTKMEIASNVLTDAVNKLRDDQQVGLVAYGHRQKEDCKDVEFLVNTENGTKASVTQSLKKIRPLGRTPLAYSALQVIDHLRKTKMKATIILVTDGIESCNGNICDVIKAAKKEGIDFRLHIIGFGLKANEKEQLKCAAKEGDGQYYDAADAGGLGDVLNEATATTVDKPKGNFSVYAVKNGKPVDALVKALKPGTDTVVSTVRTYRDSALLYMPVGKYDLRATPLEDSDVEGILISNVESFADSIAHQTISFDAGKILATASNNGEGWDAVVKVISSSTGKVIATGRTYGKTKDLEINPGTYKVYLQALNQMNGLETEFTSDDVVVTANESTSVEHNFKTGIAIIGATSGPTLIDAMVTIKESNTKKNVAGQRTYTSSSSNPKKFLLNPGTYEVTVAALGKHSGKKTSFVMTIKEGEAFEKTIAF